MSFVTRNLTSTITIWSVASVDVYMNPTYTVSYAKGRWEDKQQKTVDSLGNEIISNAVVFIDRDVPIGSFLNNGLSTSLTPITTAREVRNFSKIPNITGRLFERKAILT